MFQIKLLISSYKINISMSVHRYFRWPLDSRGGAHVPNATSPPSPLRLRACLQHVLLGSNCSSGDTFMHIFVRMRRFLWTLYRIFGNCYMIFITFSKKVLFMFRVFFEHISNLKFAFSGRFCLYIYIYIYIYNNALDVP